MGCLAVCVPFLVAPTFYTLRRTYNVMMDPHDDNRAMNRADSTHARRGQTTCIIRFKYDRYIVRTLYISSLSRNASGRGVVLVTVLAPRLARSG
eukprot:1057430-Prymnesium_polylepis.3